MANANNVLNFSIYNCPDCGRPRGGAGCTHCRRRIATLPAPRDPKKYLLIASIVITGLAVSLAGVVFSMSK